MVMSMSEQTTVDKHTLEWQIAMGKGKRGKLIHKKEKRGGKRGAGLPDRIQNTKRY